MHAEIDVFQNYIPQLLQKLTPNGVAFLHHSNVGGFDNHFGLPDHARGKSVSSRSISDLVSQSGGKVIVQEVINWVATGMLDCLTTFARAGGPEDAAAIRLFNPRFM